MCLVVNQRFRGSVAGAWSQSGGRWRRVQVRRPLRCVVVLSCGRAISPTGPSRSLIPCRLIVYVSPSVGRWAVGASAATLLIVRSTLWSWIKPSAEIPFATSKVWSFIVTNALVSVAVKVLGSDEAAWMATGRHVQENYDPRIVALWPCGRSYRPRSSASERPALRMEADHWQWFGAERSSHGARSLRNSPLSSRDQCRDPRSGAATSRSANSPASSFSVSSEVQGIQVLVRRCACEGSRPGWTCGGQRRPAAAHISRRIASHRRCRRVSHACR